MKNSAAVCVAMMAAVLALGVTDAQAQSPIRSGGKIGLGLGGGSGVNGLSLKYFTSDAQALQFTAGLYGWGGGFSALGLSADYLFELPTLLNAGPLDLGWNVGIGAGAVVGDVFGLRASGVVGLEFLFVPIPIDLVFEWRPSLIVVPGVGADIVNFSGHIRYYF